jgi:ABC-type enterobactin transport system permease subunit
VSQRSGFVPIRFHLAGKILFVLGAIGLLVTGADLITAWFGLPMIIPITCLVFVLVGLYLIYVVPREPEANS